MVGLGYIERMPTYFDKDGNEQEYAYSSKDGSSFIIEAADVTNQTELLRVTPSGLVKEGANQSITQTDALCRAFDTNGDGILRSDINEWNATQATMHACRVYPLTDECKKFDMNKDDTIDSIDAIMLFNFIQAASSSYIDTNCSQLGY